MRHRIRFFLTVFLGLSLLAPSLSFANYNYRGVIPGERAMGMGGAFIALSTTAEGGIYNPAGLAFAEYDTLSVAGNLYRLSRGERKDAITLAGSSTDLPQDAFTSIPQIASFAKRFRFWWEDSQEKRNAVALNVVVLNQNELTGRVKFDVTSGSAGGTRSLFNQTLMVGPSYARKLSRHLSVGATLGYFLTKIENVGFLSEDVATHFSQAFLHETGNIGGLVGLVGIRYSPVENLWLGFTYQSPTLRLHSNGNYYSSIAITDRTNISLANSNTDLEDLDLKFEAPQRFGFGVAFDKTRRWAVSADILLHLPNDYAYVDGTPENIHQKLAFNGSVGGEYFIAPEWAIRAGFFTNLSAAPDLQAGTRSQADQVDHYGFTFAGALETENSTLSAGGIISLGEGNGVDNLGNIISVTERSYAIVLSGSYKF